MHAHDVFAVPIRFCWTCLEPWSKHGESTGGYYSCNAFRTTGASDPSKVSEKERAVNEKKRLARMAIERYSHYHERWASHEDAEKRAKKDMETLIAKSWTMWEETTALAREK